MKDNERNILIIVVVVLLFFFLFGGFGMMGYNNYGYGMMGNIMGFSGFGFMWLLGWLFMILIIVALVFLIIWLAKQIQKPHYKQTEYRKARK